MKPAEYTTHRPLPLDTHVDVLNWLQSGTQLLADHSHSALAVHEAVVVARWHDALQYFAATSHKQLASEAHAACVVYANLHCMLHVEVV
jgi:hypothetical protein